VSGALPSTRIDPAAERDRARREVAHFEAVLAEHPDCPRTAMMLDSARSWLARAESTLRASGWEPS
jgi:hypothetical protein